MKNAKSPFVFESEDWERKWNFVHVDSWVKRPLNLQDDMLEQDTIFTTNKGAIIAPVHWFYNMEKAPTHGVDMLDFFTTTPKKCYNSMFMRNHICTYLNYFERFYDVDKEYFAIICNMKWLMDYHIEYTEECFKYDINRYVLGESLIGKTYNMAYDNYNLKLSYKNITNPALQYSDDNAITLMQISLLMNLCIPLTTHYAHLKKIEGIDDFLLEIFDKIFDKFNTDVDMYSKVYETSFTNVGRNEKNNKILWGMQDIRGINVTTHSISSTDNIVLNIMPKYVFNSNIVNLNYTSINKNTGFQITDIAYDFSFVQLSSSKRDEDSISEFDKFEASLTKASESLYLQNKINAYETMNRIEYLYGPFNEKEIRFYAKAINTEHTVNSFQQGVVFNLFFKFFGDTISAYGINNDDYIKLIIVAKKLLLSNGMILLPHIISSRVEKLVGRKTINKKEIVKMETSNNYKLVMEKYKNEKIVKQILSLAATIISSDFTFIEPNNPEMNGLKIDIVPDIIIEEILIYALLV